MAVSENSVPERPFRAYLAYIDRHVSGTFLAFQAFFLVYGAHLNFLSLRWACLHAPVLAPAACLQRSGPTSRPAFNNYSVVQQATQAHAPCLVYVLEKYEL